MTLPETAIADFRLKRFFNEDPGPTATYNLSPSFCEPLTVGELPANQPAAREELERLPLGYPGLHGSPALRR
ncbi:MAG TPA: hypothetical protein VKF37_20375 [Chloroflexota bacterium]|nr:hypothetical protein [Chloroflexota bacterium]